MERVIHSKNIEIGESISFYIDKKLKKIEKFFKRDSTAKINFEIEKVTYHHKKGAIYRAEINILIENTLLRAEARTESLYSAIDEAQAEILRQTKKFKKKRFDLFVRGARLLKQATHLSPSVLIRRIKNRR